MNTIAIYYGGIQVYWSSVIIFIGMIVFIAISLALYKPRNESTAAMWIFFPLAFIFSFIISRALHYYFNAESYESFVKAMTDFSTGSFMLPGMLLGMWFAAAVVKAMGLTSSSARLLDYITPGGCLLIAFIRLSALFNDSCRSKIIISAPIFQRLPFAVSTSDNAGNVTYRLATFFIEFIIMAVMAVIALKFFKNNRRQKMARPCPKTGNVMRIMLVAYGAIEIIMDSTRNDSPLLHFRLISVLNQWSAFISLAQVFAAISSLCVLIYYSKMSIKANGFSWRQPSLWLLFVASLFGIGYLGEYRVQRYGTQKYLECYAIMAICCLLMFSSVYLIYRQCMEFDNEYEY